MNTSKELVRRHPDLFVELKSLLNKVDPTKPEQGGVDALAVFLEHHPEFWRICGDLAEVAVNRMIAEMKVPEAMKKSMTTGMEQLAVELARPGDGNLEHLIIQQIAGCWLRLSYIEFVYGRIVVDGNEKIEQANFWERRISAAQRRYLRAIESLARVRRLNLPAVQVNIAEQQVNQVNQS